MLGSTRPEYVSFKRYMRPSGICQACLSYNNTEKDYLLTCDLCRSCIHSQHYGFDSGLQEPWKCQRCRVLLQHGPNTNIKCRFCPSVKGIMKQYTFDNQRIWVKYRLKKLHPQCAVWGYPTISFTNQKRNAIQRAKAKNDADYFWTPQLAGNQHPCTVCNGKQGYKIRCKYYSCTKSYHITCAITLGVVRDLESMKIQKTGGSGGYFPVYCRDHINKKVIDYKKRANDLEKDDKQKSAHFRKVAFLYEVQLKNLDEAGQKYKKQDKIIQFLHKKAQKTINSGKHLSFSDMQDSYESSCSQGYLNDIQNEIIDQGVKLNSIESLKKILQQNQMVDEDQISNHPQRKVSNLLKQNLETAKRPSDINFEQKKVNQQENKQGLKQQIQKQQSQLNNNKKNNLKSDFESQYDKLFSSLM